MCNFDEEPIYLGFTRFIFKRDYLICNNIFFPEIRHDEDGVFMCRAASIAKYYLVLPKVVYYRRQIPKPDSLYGDEEALIGSIEVIRMLNKTKFHRKLYWENIYDISDALPFVFHRYCLGINEDYIINVLRDLSGLLWDSEARAFLKINEATGVSESWILNCYSLLEKKYKTYQEVITKADRIFIYGAGTIGKYAQNLIEKIFKKNIESFVVSNKGDKADSGGKAIIGVERLSNITNALVIVAMHKRWHKDIEEFLYKYSFKGNVIYWGNDIKHFISVLSEDVSRF